MKSMSHIIKDISLDLNIRCLAIKFDDPVPDTIHIEWARGIFFQANNMLCRWQADPDPGDPHSQGWLGR